MLFIGRFRNGGLVLKGRGKRVCERRTGAQLSSSLQGQGVMFGVVHIRLFKRIKGSAGGGQVQTKT